MGSRKTGWHGKDSGGWVLEVEVGCGFRGLSAIALLGLGSNRQHVNSRNKTWGLGPFIH
jgi:hypothetical protein